MSKTIRVTQQTWDRLEGLRDWKDSFNQVITRLLDLHDVMTKVEPLLAGPADQWRGKIAREKAQAASNPE